MTPRERLEELLELGASFSGPVRIQELISGHEVPCSAERPRLMDGVGS